MKDFLSKDVVRAMCRRFNAQDEEPYRGDISNASAEEFLCEQIPRFSCPDSVLEEIWYFRWWSFRKHIRTTPYGRVLLEFMPDVPWAGVYNTINCPATHQLREARWFWDKSIAEDYLAFWLHPDAGADKRKYTFGPANTALDVAAVTGDISLATRLLPALRENYDGWCASHRRENGLFWQIDSRDGMECSIGGNGYRTILNSCMAAEAQALATLARLQPGTAELVQRYTEEAERLQSHIVRQLWNEDMQFFMTRREEDFSFVNVRELHGYTPWYFLSGLPEAYDVAWRQLHDPEGFAAPYGPTTAERRHPGFQLDRSGHECQWNGPSWPFATSVTLTALERLLHERPSACVSKRDYFECLCGYARSHYLRENGQVIPWIDENQDPFTGQWLARDILRQWEREGRQSKAICHERGKDYSHSTFADLVITGLCGVSVSWTGQLVVDPLLPAESWSYFLLEGVRVHGHDLTVAYDRDGSAYGRERGLTLYVDGAVAAHRDDLGKLEVRLNG